MSFQPERTVSVPRRVETLLQSLGADPELTDDVLGDLAEEFALRCRWDGVTAARRWYYREAWRTAPHLLRDWRRRFRPTDARPLLGAVAAAFATNLVFGMVLPQVVFWVTGVPLVSDWRHWQSTGEMVPWLALMMFGRNTLPAIVAGFVGGSRQGRAIVPNTLAIAFGLIGVTTLVLIAAGAPLSVLGIATVVNAPRIIVSCFAGSIAALLWRRRARAV